MKKLLLAATALVALIGPTRANGLHTYGEGDLPTIMKTKDTNEYVFDRDYAKQIFSTVRMFNVIGHYGANYIVHFTWHEDQLGSPIGGNVLCEVNESDPKLEEMSKWPQGQRAQIVGIIDTVWMDILYLKDCTIYKVGKPYDIGIRAGETQGQPGQELVCPVTADGHHDVCYWRDINDR